MTVRALRPTLLFLPLVEYLLPPGLYDEGFAMSFREADGCHDIIRGARLLASWPMEMPGRVTSVAQSNVHCLKRIRSVSNFEDEETMTHLGARIGPTLVIFVVTKIP